MASEAYFQWDAGSGTIRCVTALSVTFVVNPLARTLKAVTLGANVPGLGLTR